MDTEHRERIRERSVAGRRGRLVRVHGPAYLDRVVRIDGPLRPPSRVAGRAVDSSMQGRWAGLSADLEIVDTAGCRLRVLLPEGASHLRGVVQLDSTLAIEDGPPWVRTVQAVEVSDDLGGMGAGYAAAFGGILVSALGDPDDPVSRAIQARIEALDLFEHRPVVVAGQAADWTLLISSGPYGDKLAIGFRGCHEAWSTQEIGRPSTTGDTADLCIVAGLINAHAVQVLRASLAGVRFLAPTMRNMRGTGATPPISSFGRLINALSCNREEWAAIAPDEARQIARAIPLVIVTDGPRGHAVVRPGSDRTLSFQTSPAFPRARPPRDTNRAGECFAAVFLDTIMNGGWEDLIRGRGLLGTALDRAGAAAALTLDLTHFGFPSRAEIDQAIAAGQVD